MKSEAPPLDPRSERGEESWNTFVSDRYWVSQTPCPRRFPLPLEKGEGEGEGSFRLHHHLGERDEARRAPRTTEICPYNVSGIRFNWSMRSSHSHHAVGFALALACAAQAATYEVAQQNPQASDDGPGTTDQPWKTIARAADKVGPADVVVIHGGVYRERVVAKSNG